MPEAPARQTKFGLVYDGDGWFVINARETRRRSLGRDPGCKRDRSREEEGIREKQRDEIADGEPLQAARPLERTIDRGIGARGHVPTIGFSTRVLECARLH